MAGSPRRMACPIHSNNKQHTHVHTLYIYLNNKKSLHIRCKRHPRVSIRHIPFGVSNYSSYNHRCYKGKSSEKTKKSNYIVRYLNKYPTFYFHKIAAFTTLFPSPHFHFKKAKRHIIIRKTTENSGIALVPQISTIRAPPLKVR